MAVGALLALVLVWPMAVSAQPRPGDAVAAFVAQLEQTVAAGDADAILALSAGSDTRGLPMFAALAVPKPTRIIIKERDRSTREPAGERLLIEVLVEYGGEATITTWRADLAPDPSSPAGRRIVDMEQLTIVDGLHKLGLNRLKQYDVRNLTVQGTDLTLQVAAGSAFVAETNEGPTALIVLGRGQMRFAPSDSAERTQIRIFGGDTALTAEFDAVFLRVRPAEFHETIPATALTPVAVNGREFRRATDVFDDYIGQTFSLDLRDLSREGWSLIPTGGDLLAEVRTRRFGSLTYARSTKDAEDISLFDRRRRRNIAMYASPQKLASRGRFYGEDELVEYNILRHQLDVAFSPDRLWLEGTANIDLQVRAHALTSITLRLAEPLTVRNVSAPQFGRLLHLRVVGQNSIIVNFPSTLPRGTVLRLSIAYGGRLEPQQIDREGIAVDQPGNAQADEIYIPVEPQFLYSNRSYWYPQSMVTDYATSQLRVTVPAEFDVVATGTETGPPGPAPGAGPQGPRSRKLFVYEAHQPVRYLACVLSRFTRVATREVTVSNPSAGALPSAPLTLSVHANPRQASRARAITSRAAAILEFYGGLIGEAPYPTFTLALTESELPGGHSPGYFAVLNQPLPLAPNVWRNDPVAFEDYPPYFLAHEVAHQWWGQAIGWKNYHEQWISEGFSQYFAALYAAHDRGEDVFRGMLRQMQRWSVEESGQGPVYLGYRLGHIKADGRVFRALVYNKGAMVLHMLRRLIGSEKFFAGIRQFYADWKFKKAGTNDFRLAMEKASGADLASFFDAWIYGSEVPVLAFTSSAAAGQARLRFEHRGPVIPTPVTVSIAYADGSSEELVVPVTERVVERTVPLRGTVRTIDANRDYAAVAEIDR